MSLKAELIRLTTFAELEDLLSAKENSQKEMRSQIGCLGGRYFKKVGFSGTVCLNDIVKKFKNLHDSIDVRSKNSADLEKFQQNTKKILERIKQLDSNANEKLEGFSCFTKLCTRIKRFFGDRLNRTKVLNDFTHSMTQLDSFVKENKAKEATVVQVDQSDFSNLAEAKELYATNSPLLLKLVYTKKLLQVPGDELKSAVASSEALKFLIETLSEAAQTDVDSLSKKEEVDKFLYTLFEVTEKETKESPKLMQERFEILLQYTKILENYSVEELCEFRLVSALTQVFQKHFKREDSNLFSTGIPFHPDNTSTYYAKVDQKKVYIVAGKGKLLFKGRSGTVYKTMEIASKQFMILKVAIWQKNKILFAENDNLEELHKNGKRPGTQWRSFTLFNHRDLVATLNYYYSNNDLYVYFSKNAPTPLERIVICKKMLVAFQSKVDADFWHGDIKLENFFVDGQINPFLGDWAETSTFKQAIETWKIPLAYTPGYLSVSDKENMLRAKRERNEKEFRKAGESSDLYALSVALFVSLTGGFPYTSIKIGDSDMPNPKADLDDKILKAYYNDAIGAVMRKMLAHNSAHRYTWEEARKVWDTITPEQGIRD